MRTLTLHLAMLLAAVFSGGCDSMLDSSLHMTSKRQLQRFDGGTRPVYVTNPELQQEYEVLRASGIYPLSSQRDGARVLTLHPIRQHGRCGMPLMCTILTFGIVPGTLPADRTFKYELQTDGVTETREHWLPLYERFSIWERLFQRDKQKVLAKALAWSAPQRPDKGAAAPDRRPDGQSAYAELPRDKSDSSRELAGPGVSGGDR